MSRLDRLKAVNTKPQFARLLGIHPSLLTYTLYKKRPEHCYHEFKIPKKSGGKRTINAPDEKLKSIQRALADLLLDCLDEINAVYFPSAETLKPKAKHADILKVKCNSALSKQPALSHGFERKRSILTNAVMHLDKKHLLNIDLKDFFPSFNFGRVRGFFIKNNHFKLHPSTATLIAQIAILNNELPQGSPCSPVIANLITHHLDIRLASLAAKYSCTYTRYADDITFSTRRAAFPRQIMNEKDGGYIPSKRLASEVNRAGFRINSQKTRILYRDSRQEVTGLVANKKVGVKKEYWRTLRAQCHSLFTTDSFTKIVDGKKVEGNINELEGQLNFVDQVDRYNRLRQKQPLNPLLALRSEQKNGDKKSKRHLLNNRERTLSDFLFYKLFISNSKTTILTEGKTDNTYLKSAIQALAKRFPTLAETKPYQPLVQFMNYSERTRFLLELFGGCDYLKAFAENYSSRRKKYLKEKPTSPVILLLDNDQGPKDLINRFSKDKSITLLPSTSKNIRDAEFVHVCDNLYLVLTPISPKRKETDIEYFFMAKTRLLKDSKTGKCFNTISKRDEKRDLSKEAFAQLVKTNKGSINFSRFGPLLTRITKVQKHYAAL
ncbi:hypothetical protein KUL150_30600 [Alteromonas sp. KUL150]|uniref:retron Ec67 family RNA-directed DNA polymerase/endonuclease n=1 Tax=Alteromonas sp. KUL150 TaxID=2480805 RepID=UPI0012E44AC5|nr:retron Ec67 family RNA-directed DNA polymerase/endonuclease [Alteromonas sp. KUL150]GFD87001.1 hypothetical protein KUL150_30600 [Alteromonas sp. KUL150]